MFLNVKTIEAKLEKVKLNDVQADTKKLLLYFLYNDEIEDTKMINAKLLVAVCSYYLKQNISVENGIDILVTANMTNQKAMFDSCCFDSVASDFIISNQTSAFGKNSRKPTL